MLTATNQKLQKSYAGDWQLTDLNIRPTVHVFCDYDLAIILIIAVLACFKAMTLQSLLYLLMMTSMCSKHLRCGGIFSDGIIANFLLILTVKQF